MSCRLVVPSLRPSREASEAACQWQRSQKPSKRPLWIRASLVRPWQSPGSFLEIHHTTTRGPSNAQLSAPGRWFLSCLGGRQLVFPCISSRLQIAAVLLSMLAPEGQKWYHDPDLVTAVP